MVLTKTPPRFVVLGGAGTIGRFIVRDLYESNSKNQIVVADFDLDAARQTAAKYRSKRVTAASVDARSLSSLTSVLHAQSVALNCTHHQFNLTIMEAALQAGVHYLDLGGLFVWTRRQLRYHRRFQQAGLTAILGMGCAPGLTNVMAAAAAAQLERVDSIRIRIGGVDFNRLTDEFAFPYSAQTIVEELTLPPWKWSGGRFVQTEPRSGGEWVDFGKPVGRIWTMMTRHSEIATLPLRFKSKGLRYADFKIGFDRAFVREVLKRIRAGWSVRDLEALPARRTVPHDYEISRVIVRGGKKTIVVECHARSKVSWHASAGDLDTAYPASIAAQMLVDGAAHPPGVWAPEDAVPAELLFKQLKQRGLAVRIL